MLADEPAQWPENTGERMVAALKTARGKIAGSRAVYLGTRPAGAGHFFERQLRGDRAVVYAADKEADPMRAPSWHAANPSLRWMPELRAAIREEAAEAGRDPGALAAFRALRLNQGVSDVAESSLLDAGVWEAAELTAGPEGPERSGPYCLGVDLGSGAAMSAVAAYYPESYGLDCFAAFPRLPSLKERGMRDGVGRLYEEIAARGELIVAGERVADVRELLAEVLRRWGVPRWIVCDRWREKELRQELERGGFPTGAALVTRGQGFMDGAADVREFRRAILNGYVTPPESLLLRAAMMEARTVGDAAGNWKLSKKAEGGRRALARDDAAAATVLAVAEGRRRVKSSPPPGWRYRGVA